MIITFCIIGITCLVSILAFQNPDLSAKLQYSPYIIHRKSGEWFRFISMGFVHADMGHLFGNMLTLFFFGRVIEQLFSPLEYILLYVTALVVSVAPNYNKRKNNPAYAAVGASGAVSAITFAIVLFGPWESIYLYFAVPLPFILYAVGYLLYSGYQAKKEPGDGIAHDAHLWGALYGIAFTLLTHPGVLNTFIYELMHPHFGR